MVPGRRQLLAAYVLSATAVLVAAGGSLLYSETASVKLSVPRQSLGALVTLTGLATQRIQASITDSQQGISSKIQISPTYAVGQVVFRCSPACPIAPFNIASGTLITTAKSLGYATQVAATIMTSTGSAPVAVRATAPGAAWNTDHDTLTIIVNKTDPSLQVTNPAPISGGTNSRSAEIIQQSDFDTVRNALTIKVSDELAAALRVNAQGMSYITDALPVINLISDHNVGEETPSFTITMTGTIGAIAFSASEAQALMRAGLEAKIPPDEELTTDPIQTVYQIQQASSNGSAIVIGKAVGFVIPKLSPQSLRSQIRGLSPAAAAKSLQRTAPGSLVEIRISPVALPWLPIIAEHINFTVVVEPAPA